MDIGRPPYGKKLSLLPYVEALENKSSEARGREVLAVLDRFSIKPTVQCCRFPRIKNIIVDLGPEARQGKTPVFSAHYDVVKAMPGANDNASGVAVLLGLCQLLAGTAPPIRVIFFDREEAWFRTPVLRLGLLGSTYYVRKCGVGNVSSVYNLEACGVGGFLGIWPVRKAKEEDLPVVRNVRDVAAKLGVPCRSVHIPWYVVSSDHLSFRLGGLANAVSMSLLPTSSLTAFDSLIGKAPFRLAYQGRSKLPPPIPVFHTPEDTASRLSESSLRLMLSILIELVSSETGSASRGDTVLDAAT